MELKLYLTMLRRGWWLIALAALVAMNAGLISTYITTPMYRATASFILKPNASLSGSDVIRSLDTLNNRSIALTYAEILNSLSIYKEAAEVLQIPWGSLNEYSRSAVVLPDASVLHLSFQGPNPHLAAQLANSVGQHAINYTRGLNQVYNLEFLDPATTPSNPYSPDAMRNISLATLIGAVIGAALAIAREQLRTPLEALLQRTKIDALSSAYTRRYFERRLEEEVNRGGALSLGFVHLYGLRDLFETLPRSVTQRLLRQATTVLKRELRGNDIVGRWNDITLAIMLPSTSSSAARRTVDRIQQALSDTLAIEQIDFDLEPYTIVATSHDRLSAQELIKQAEIAMEDMRYTNTDKAGETVVLPERNLV